MTYSEYRRKESTGKKIGKIIIKILLVFFTVIIFIAATLYLSVKLICGSTSVNARNTFVTTMLETGQLKFVVSMFLEPDEIQAIVDGNSMEKFDEEVNTELITVDVEKKTEEQKDIEILEYAGRTYTATIMKVKDPSRVSIASIYPWKDKGVTLDQLVKDAGAIGGINGGLYNSSNNSGGIAYGIVVCNGEIQLNKPGQWKGLVMIGFDKNNILRVIDVDGMTPQQTENIIKTEGIRDAVTFQEESSDVNNHFVQLMINGKARGMSGMGSGLNPRTAIGQCSDGSVLLVVTDGRGKNGHLGASASDLIEIMEKFGAVNAANLDGGSSTCMYYDNEWLMTSVTFYYSNDSWRLPAGFVVK